MAQDVKLKISGDTTELEKSFNATVKKMQSEADKLKLSPAAQKSAPGVDSVRDAANTSRVLNQRVREEKAGLDIINRELARKKALVDQIAAQQASALKGSKEELALAQRLNREKERLQQSEKIAQIQQTNYNRAREAENRARGIQPNQPGGLNGLMSSIGFGGVVGGITTAVLQGINQIAGNPSRSIVAGGSAVQNTVGRELGSIYNGNFPNSLAFSKERMEAKEMADKQEAAERMKDTVRTGSAAALFAGAGATALSSGWTGVGLAGAAGLAGGGLYGLFGNDRMRAKTMSGLTKDFAPGFASRQGQEYENLIAQQNSEDFQRNYEAKRNLDPRKVLATDYYNQNAQRDLDFQRQMGLDSGSFRGNFKNGIFNAGFDDVSGMGMASSIMNAGGSTRSSVGNAALGLQAQRNLDMTNSGGVLGKLSGSLGSADTTNEAFVKVLAEGTRVGLDGSDFREENRKFVESAANMIAQSGVTSGAGIDQILSQFGRFFGDKTMTGMDAGKNAYDLYRQNSMATTGPRGTMRAAGMLNDPTISKLDRDSREALFNMPADQLTSDNPAIIAMAKQANVSPQQLIDAQNKITSKSLNQFTRSDAATQKLRSTLSKYGRPSAMDMQGPFAPGEKEEIMTALGESNIAQIKENPILGQNQRTTSSYSDALAQGDIKRSNAALEEAKKQQLQGGGQGRPEDETNRVRAEMSREVNKIFLDMQNSIVPASKAAAVFVDNLNKMTAAMMALPAEQRGAFANKNLLPIFGYPASNAPTAGSPSSGGGSGH